MVKHEPNKQHIGDGMDIHVNSDGYTCFTLNYRAQTEESIDIDVINQERKKQELHPIVSVSQYFDWLAEGVGGKDNPIWREEMENDPYAHTKKLAAYFNYDRDFHTSSYPGHLSGIPIYISIDFGFHRPCAIVAQSEEKHGHTFLYLHHTLREPDLDFEVFLNMLIDYAAKEFPYSEVKWCMTQEGISASGSGFTKSGMKSPYELMCSKGLKPFYKWHHIHDGVDLINKVLGKSVNKGLPLISINPDDRNLNEMFAGGYRRREITIDGQQVTTPTFIKDNWYDDVSDAIRPLFQYHYKFHMNEKKGPKGRRGGINFPI